MDRKEYIENEGYDYENDSDIESVWIETSFDDFEYNGRKWKIDIEAYGHVYYEYEHDSGDWWTPPSTEIIDAYVSDYDISYDSDDDDWNSGWWRDENVKKMVIRQYGDTIEELLLDKFYGR